MQIFKYALDHSCKNHVASVCDVDMNMNITYYHFITSYTGISKMNRIDVEFEFYRAYYCCL